MLFSVAQVNCSSHIFFLYWNGISCRHTDSVPHAWASQQVSPSPIGCFPIAVRSEVFLRLALLCAFVRIRILDLDYGIFQFATYLIFRFRQKGTIGALGHTDLILLIVGRPASRPCPSCRSKGVCCYCWRLLCRRCTRS